VQWGPRRWDDESRNLYIRTYYLGKEFWNMSKLTKVDDFAIFQDLLTRQIVAAI
jgi:hypothetical protein